METCLNFKSFVKRERKKLIALFTAAIIAAVLSATLYTVIQRLCYGSWTFTGRALYSPDTLIRALFFFALYAFVGACIIFDRRKIFDFVFRNRWYVSLGVFVLFVALKINFSSVGAFDYFVQPDMRTDTTLPIFGIPRSIRSDEWLVYVPRAFTCDFSGFGEFNNILRATENYSIAANGLKLGWSAFCSPMSWGYYLFGAEYGLSFYWSFLMIMGFMASYEFSLIISRGSRRLALFGGAFIGLSQFSMWWSVCTYLISAQMLLVFAYYFFEKQGIVKKVFLALGAAFSAAFFISALYPAWQVPFGYILIGLAVWLIVTELDKIRSLRFYEVIIIAAAFILMASFVLAYLMDSAEANKSILETVYPGKRFDTGKGGLVKAGAFLHTPLLPFKTVSVANNNSDASMFFSLFPLPMIFSAYTFVRQLVRRRTDKTVKIDVFNIAVLIPAVFLTVYASVGIPAWLAKYTLLSYSMGIRVADFIGLANVYLLIRALSDKEERIPLSVFVPVGALCSVFWVYCSYKYVPDFIPIWFCVISLLLALGLAALAYIELPERPHAISVTSFAALACILGLCVHPVMSGADALIEKPMSLAVRAEVSENPDAKWVGYGNHVVGQYLVANGAPTVNSVNYIPNLEMWSLFDPDGEMAHIYNRYAHLKITFTEGETEISLIQLDFVELKLNFADIKKLDVSYVASITNEIDFGLSDTELKDKYGIGFVKIYSESNSCIYKIIYY